MKLLKLIAFLIGAMVVTPQYAQNPIDQYDEIYHLDESTKIMNELIKTNDLSKLLLPEEQLYSEFYINNFSPAQLAYGAEVRACINPVLVICCNDDELIILEPVCKKIMIQYPGLKIVTVNDEALPSIVAMLNVQKLPTLIFVDQDKELGRVEGTINLEADFENLLNSLGA